MEAEQASLTGEKEALEMEKTGIKEELVRVEQEKMDLDTEKMGRCTTHCIKAINDRHARGAGLYTRHWEDEEVHHAAAQFTA